MGVHRRRSHGVAQKEVKREWNWGQSNKSRQITCGNKLNLDIFWLKDESCEDSANLLSPDVIAAEIDSLVPALSPFGLPRPCRPLPRCPLSKTSKRP